MNREVKKKNKTTGESKNNNNKKETQIRLVTTAVL